MLSELLPMNLSDAARRLGVDPFELMRILVATNSVPKDLVFRAAEVDALREPAGIDEAWWKDVVLPDDVNPRRQRVRGVLHMLLAGGATRKDNVWRGLEASERELVRGAVDILVEEGLLAEATTKALTSLSVADGSEERVRAIADGEADTSALSALYEG